MPGDNHSNVAYVIWNTDSVLSKEHMEVETACVRSGFARVPERHPEGLGPAAWSIATRHFSRGAARVRVR